jgi:nucleotide-binding universal stress UspA family protein
MTDTETSAVDLSQRQFDRILIPTDGSPTSHVALETGLEMARLMDSEVTGLYVMDNSAYAAFPGELEWDAIKDMLAQESEAALGAVEEACETHGLPCQVRVREGHPADEILAAAEDHDLIVMGTHGRSGLEHLLLGSVTEKVIRHSTCPVLIVRDEDEDDEDG